MRGLCLTVLFGLLGVGVLALVAVEQYAWNSWHAHTLVRSVELVVVVAVVVLFYVGLLVLRLIDWCDLLLYRIRTRNRRRQGQDQNLQGK